MATAQIKWDGVKLSGTRDSQTAEVVYVVDEAADESEAITYALSIAPTTYAGIPITDLATSDRLAEEMWLVSVKYSTRQADQPKDAREASSSSEPDEGVNYELEFECQAGTVHITRSLYTLDSALTTDTIADYTPTIIDFSNNINDTGEEVLGIDFPPEADFKWSETHYILNDSINDGYIRTLRRMAGKVNDQEFRKCEQGCVLFRGVSGKRKDTTSWALTFRFEYIAPSNSEEVPGFDPISKDGYDIVWFRRVSVPDSSGKRIIQKAVQLNIEQVAERVDFLDLGIGELGLD